MESKVASHTADHGNLVGPHYLVDPELTTALGCLIHCADRAHAVNTGRGLISISSSLIFVVLENKAFS